MKLPQDFDMSFYKQLYISGWIEDREPLLEELPAGLSDLPETVQNFVRTLWWITICKECYVYDALTEQFTTRYEFFTFGQQDIPLDDLSSETDYYHYVTADTGLNLRVFGFTHQMGRICIDDCGRIYVIENELYYFDGSYYEGLRNLYYNSGNLYIVTERGVLSQIDRTTRKIKNTDISLHS